MTTDRSRLVSAGYFFGLAGLACVVIGILGIQARILAPMVGFGLFALGTAVGGIVAIVLGGLALIRKSHLRAEGDRKRATTATALGLALLAILFLSAGIGGGAPPINDITTDLNDPPPFAPAEAVSAYLERDMTYPPDFTAVVRSHYTELAPVDSELSPQAAYRQALSTAQAMGLTVVWQSPEEGRFDATDVTPIFRFVDDFTVRVRPRETGSRIDVRSKSRDGQGDMGTNAKRIGDFLARF